MTKPIKYHYHVWWLQHLWIGGITFGHHVFFKRKQGEVPRHLLVHEVVHVEQIEKLGRIRFYLTYLWELLRHGYRNNKFEVEARKRSGKD